MKMMRKISALVLAIMMIAAVGTAFADGAALSGGTTGTAGTALTGGIAITKQIIFVNAEDTTVREPNITYEYTVAAVTVGSTAPTVTDTNNTTVTVKNGVLAANTNTNHKATVAFTDTVTSSASSTGTADSKTFTLTFDASQFTAAGVYRYSVTESLATGSSTKAAVGISEAATYVTTRYLDVYVEWDSTHSNLEIYGYVLFEDSTNSGTTGAITTATAKSQGWVDTDSNASDTVHADVDVYTTENLLISKTATGTMADKTHSFPVTITFTKATGLSDSIKLNYAVANNGTLTKTGTDTNSVDYVTMDAALSGTVKDTSTITITGIPYGSTVTMTETNDTYDSYKVKAGTTSGAYDLLAEAPVAASATSSATSSQTLNAKQSIYITNTLDAISPTGIVLRFAPYALMLIGGIVLLVIAMKRRHHKEEE